MSSLNVHGRRFGHYRCLGNTTRLGTGEKFYRTQWILSAVNCYLCEHLPAITGSTPADKTLLSIVWLIGVGRDLNHSILPYTGYNAAAADIGRHDHLRWCHRTL